MIANAEPHFFGHAASSWTFLFGAASTVVVVGGLVLAIYGVTQTNSQRLTNSMSKLFDEYREATFGESLRHVSKRFPIFDGSVDERVTEFVRYGKKNLGSVDMGHARVVVHKLNDIGIFVERRSVREADFFRTLHPRIIEIGARLEMVILVATAHDKSRWGMRVRRLARGATVYYRMSKLYNTQDFVKDGHVLVAAGKPPRRERFRIHVRRMFGRLGYLMTASQALKTETADIVAVSQALRAFSPSDLSFLEK